MTRRIASRLQHVLAGILAVSLLGTAAAQEKKADQKDPPRRKQVSQPAALKADETKQKQQYKKGNPKALPEPTVQLKPGEVPAVKFESLIHNFGRKRAGDDVFYDFKFKNTGTGPLELIRVKPSCGCTTADEFDKIVPPGETGTIPIKLATARAGGKITKTIDVFTNITGPDAQVKLTITGEIWYPIQASPRSASFGRIYPPAVDEPLTRTLLITNNTDKDSKIEIEEVTNNAFKAELKETEPGKQYELTVTLMKPPKKGASAGQIKLATDLDDSPELAIPVSVYAAQPVEVRPSQLTLRGGRRGSTNQRFFVHVYAKEPVEISDLKATSDAVKLELEEPPAAKLTASRGPTTYQTFHFNAKIPEDFHAKPDDLITLRTSHPDVPLVTIPIREYTPPTPVASGKRKIPADTPTQGNKTGGKKATPDGAISEKDAPAKAGTN